MKEETSKIELDDLVKGIQESVLEDEREIYTEKTLEEAYNPKNVGELKNADGFGKVTGPCGDTVQIYLKVEDGEITDSKFLTDGCGVSIACGSVITEMVKEKTIKKAMTIEDSDIITILGNLPEEHLHCPILAVNTLKAAIDDYAHRYRKPFL